VVITSTFMARFLVGHEGYGRRIDVIRRHNVHVSGPEGARPIVFAHGFGCDQTMWRHVAPAFEDDHRVVVYDLMGLGGSDVAEYSSDRYSSLDGHADDLVSLLDGLDLRDAVFVGHSVSSMVGALAVARGTDRIGALVMVGPSPRYIDDPDSGYVGGFGAADIDELLESLESNYLGWSSAMAPVIVGNVDRPELGEELTATFCRADPAMAHDFARATFLSDNRADLARVAVPTLVLQCTDDVIAPDVVGQYVAANVAGSTFRKLNATGHCPNLSAPAETIAAIRDFLS
jgi:sigma-B regulation protein RsbQ